jgi:hypothetical protein
MCAYIFFHKKKKKKLLKKKNHKIHQGRQKKEELDTATSATRHSAVGRCRCTLHWGARKFDTDGLTFNLDTVHLGLQM